MAARKGGKTATHTELAVLAFFPIAWVRFLDFVAWANSGRRDCISLESRYPFFDSIGPVSLSLATAVSSVY
jgi:hypothetical protein